MLLSVFWFVWLLAALAENGRLNKVSGVLSAFAKIMSAHRGEVMCSVTTAKVCHRDLGLVAVHQTQLNLNTTLVRRLVPLRKKMRCTNTI